MRKYKYDFFVCYSMKDSDVVVPIMDSISKSGYSAWCDINIMAGDCYSDALVRILKESRSVLFLSSVNSNASEIVINQLRFALNSDKLIIPVRLDRSDYPPELMFLLGDIDAVEYTSEDSLKKVFTIYRSVSEEAEEETGDLSSSQRIFISYKRDDKDKVLRIKDEIERTVGERCWIDLDGIESDAQFVDVIIGAIKRCDIFLFMYSRRHSDIRDMEADWTIKELNFAREQKKRIVFVNIDKTPLADYFKFMFGTKQQVDILDAAAKSRLFNDLRIWLGKPVTGPIEPVQRNWKRLGIVSAILAVVILAVAYVIFDGASGKSAGSSLPSPTEGRTGQLQDADELYRQGDVFYKAKDYVRAAGLFREAAGLGHAMAQCMAGVCYELGRGVIPNPEEAVKWYTKAAEQGNARARCNLASCYKDGIGVAADPYKAYTLYKVSADQGYVNAQYYLGECYEKGVGVTPDPVAAMDWYAKADRNGHHKAGEAVQRLSNSR